MPIERIIARTWIVLVTVLTTSSVTLKLGGFEAWPWEWVLAPVWGSVVLFIGLSIASGVVCMIGAVLHALWDIDFDDVPEDRFF